MALVQGEALGEAEAQSDTVAEAQREGEPLAERERLADADGVIEGEAELLAQREALGVGEEEPLSLTELDADGDSEFV